MRGSKTVRMASGNRRELVVDQNLRLNISGHLTEDIAVEATLSDDNLPVVPEGNTEELRDIDRVRVDVTAPTWNAVLGDFVQAQMTGLPIPEDSFVDGSWAQQIPALVALPRRKPTHVNGAEEVADLVLSPASPIT